jgi:hypothetical protein
MYVFSLILKISHKKLTFSEITPCKTLKKLYNSFCGLFNFNEDDCKHED